jgi:YidC/Oxa1 family membrane protein insertase
LADGPRIVPRKPIIMQQKNLLLFVLLTALIFIGWARFVAWKWPQPQRPHQEAKIRLPEPKLWSTVPAQLQAALEQAPGMPGIAGACKIATDLALADLEASGPRALARREPEPPPKPAPAPRPVQMAEHREVTLGSDDPASPFNLRVVLTSRGAGVQSVVLNKFKEANRLGLPAGNPPPPLGLVPTDRQHPSFILYHYAEPVEGHPEHPLATLGETEWAVVKGSEKTGPDEKVQQVSFAAQVPGQGVTVTRTYTLERGTYHLGLSVRLERDRSETRPIQFRYQLQGAHGLPIEGEWYTMIFRNALIGLEDQRRQMWRELETSDQVGRMDGGNDVLRTDERFIRYAGVATQYFASMTVVDDQQAEGVGQNFLAWARPTREGEPNAHKPYLDDMAMRVISEPIELKPGAAVTHRYLLYHGPVKVRLLAHLDGDRAVDAELVHRYEHTLGLNTLTDFGKFSFWTDLLIACTNLMHGLLYYIHRFVMPWSYGLCIILLTVLVRGIMFPVSRKQAIAQARVQEKMQELQPDIKKLEEKYRNDKMALNQAKHELMIKRGVNPLAMMGTCWIAFAQMPIFLGLYYCLQESIHFRLAPFLWIKNLAAPDMLIGWGEHIPWISDPINQGSFLYLGPFFNILPIIAVALMMVQQKMMTPPPTDEQQEMNQKVMKWMTVFFGLMFYKVASGLCLYFIASNLWGLAERKLLPKRQTGSAPPATGKGRGGPGTTAKLKPKGPKGNGDGVGQRVKDWSARWLKEARK